MTEIERKFRVREVPATLGDDDGDGDGTHLRQAYLAVDGEIEVRVRDRGDEQELGIKGGSGMERTEVEVGIDAATFDTLWDLAPGRRIDKTRYRVPLGDHTAEVDVYAGTLEGLVVVEVEFASRDAAEAFTAPAWFGDELTGDARWSNAALAAHGPPD